MSDRSTGASDDRTTGAARESATERTSVITEPVGEPVHGRSTGQDPWEDETEQATPGGEPARGVLGGAPPWQRGVSEGIDVGRPQHAAGHSGPPPDGDRPSGGERTYAFSDGSVPSLADAPTSYFEPVADPEREQFAARGYDQGPISAEQPVFEHAAPATSRSASTRLRTSRAPRRASLQLKRFDPWSVLKLSLVLSVAGFLAWMVAVGLLYGVLEGMGVWDQLNGTYSDLTSVSNPQSGGDLISGGGVFGVAAVVGAINVVLITAMATVGSFIYNVASDLVGGIELTLSERD